MAASRKSHEEQLAKRRIESFFAPQREAMERREKAMLGVAEAAQDYISARNRLGAETRKFSDAMGRDIPRGQLAEVVGVSRKELDTVVALVKKDDDQTDPDTGQENPDGKKDGKEPDDASGKEEGQDTPDQPGQDESGSGDGDGQPDTGQGHPGFGITGY